MNFNQDYFTGGDPAGYTDYRRSLHHFDRYADIIHEKLTSQGIDPSGKKVLICGCAFGYTIEWLIDKYNVDCYGMDISQYAVNQADSEIAYGNRIYQGDIRNSNDIKNVRQSTPGGKFSLIITEAVLSCLNDTDAETATSNIRNEAKTVVHRVWTDSNPDYYNVKTLSEWQTLCDPNGNDYWYPESDFR